MFGPWGHIHWAPCGPIRLPSPRSHTPPNFINISHLVYVCALLLADSSECAHNTGGFINWSRESLLQLTCYNNPPDAYEIQIKDVAQLIKPHHMAHRINTGRLASDGVCSVSLPKPYFQGLWSGPCLPEDLQVCTSIGPAARQPGDLATYGGTLGEEDRRSVSEQLSAWDLEGLHV